MCKITIFLGIMQIALYYIYSMFIVYLSYIYSIFILYLWYVEGCLRVAVCNEELGVRNEEWEVGKYILF